MGSRSVRVGATFQREDAEPNENRRNVDIYTLPNGVTDALVPQGDEWKEYQPGKDRCPITRGKTVDNINGDECGHLGEELDAVGTGGI